MSRTILCITQGEEAIRKMKVGPSNSIKIAEMNSSLSPDAEVIFKILNIPITRSTAMVVPKN